MGIDDFDITFCRGKVEYTDTHGDTDVQVSLDCPVKKSCKRYWTEKHAEKAIRTGNIYNSFFMLTDPNVLTDKGCDNYWKNFD